MRLSVAVHFRFETRCGTQLGKGGCGKVPTMGERSRFVLQLAKSRWLVVLAAIWIQCSSGSSYNFGIYSQTVKDTFSYDQKSLDTLASCKDLGSNVGILSGLIFDWFSPRGVLVIGAVQSGIAYLLMWLSITGRIPAPQFWQMCLYMFLAANGQTFFNTASVVTCVQNFPRNRGVVIGLMKGLLGLSGAILTQLYHAVYGSEPSSYLLMATWLPTGITLLLMVMVRPVPVRNESRESKYLFVLCMIAVCLAAFLMGVILLENTTSVNHSGYVAVCVVSGGVLLLPLGVVVKAELKEAALFSLPSLKQPLLISDGSEPSSLSRCVASVPTAGNVRDERVEKSQSTSRLSAAEARADLNPNIAVTFPQKGCLLSVQPSGKSSCSRGQEHTFPEAIAKVDFWLLFVAMACGMGSGLTAIDNTGQIGASLGYNPSQVGTFVSLFSIWNFFGRLGFGTLSEFCLHRYRIGRPVLLASSQAFMAVGYITVSSALPGSLYPALTIIGLCYGAQWSLMPAITSELFGLSRFATLFNTISIASPIGAYWLSVQVAGRLYDAEAAKGYHEWNSEGMDCDGAHCFRLTFIILAAVSVFGCCVCGLLAHRTQSFYARALHNPVLSK